jgi:hypothetical protein
VSKLDIGATSGFVFLKDIGIDIIDITNLMEPGIGECQYFVSTCHTYASKIGKVSIFFDLKKKTK